MLLFASIYYKELMVLMSIINGTEFLSWYVR